MNGGRGPKIVDEVLDLSRPLYDYSHYSSFAEAREKYGSKEAILLASISDKDTCTTYNCNCGPNNRCACKNCKCAETKELRHFHSGNCHERVFHVDHYDFLVDGVLHHQADEHCFYHGRIDVF